MSSRKFKNSEFSDDETIGEDTTSSLYESEGDDDEDENLDEKESAEEEEGESSDNEEEVATVEDHKKPIKQIYELFESLTPSDVKIFPKGGDEYLFQLPPIQPAVPGPPKKESNTHY